MKAQSILPIFLLLILSFALPTVAQQTASTLYQSGLYKEEVEGELHQAIEIYQKIVDGYPKDRPMAAQALLRIGLCYEKLGKSEARRAFERVLRDFADQIKTSAQAQQRLQALQTGESDQLITRQIAVPWADNSVKPSPDGRYLSFPEWGSANLGVLDVHSGETRVLTNEGTWDQPDQYAYFSIWSSDGQQLVYMWYNKTGWELRRVGLDGGEPQLLYRHPQDWLIKPHAWSADGRLVLVGYGNKEWALLAVEDGAIVAKGPAKNPIGLSLSPDDRYIAYDAPTAAQKDAHRDIYLVSAKGGTPYKLVDHNANDYAPVWTPDGQYLVFFSDRTGAAAMWAQQVEDGQPRGKPRLLHTNMEGMLPIGFSRAGTFYYARTVYYEGSGSKGDVYLATLAPNTAALTPTKLPQRFEGSNVSAAWSPDGEQIAYISVRGLGPGSTLGSCTAVLRTVATGGEREWDLPWGCLALSWSPDGQSLLVIAGKGVYSLDVNSGKPGQLFWQQQIQLHDAAWSPDSQRLFYFYLQIEKEEWPAFIAVRDTASQTEEILFRDDDLRGMALSPDGQQLAISSRKVLRVLSAAGGPPTEVWRLSGDEVFTWKIGPIWTPDGSEILIGKGIYREENDPLQRQKNDPVFEIWRISAAGGKAQKTGAWTKTFHRLSLHPDGRQLVFTRPGEYAQLNAIWLMENVPAVLSAQ